MANIVVKNSLEIAARCPVCGAVKGIDGEFERSSGKAIYAAGLKNLPLEKCGECSGSGALLGGFPRQSVLGQMLGQ